MSNYSCIYSSYLKGKEMEQEPAGSYIFTNTTTRFMKIIRPVYLPRSQTYSRAQTIIYAIIRSHERVYQLKHFFICSPGCDNFVPILDSYLGLIIQLDRQSQCTQVLWVTGYVLWCESSRFFVLIKLLTIPAPPIYFCL